MHVFTNSHSVSVSSHHDAALALGVKFTGRQVVSEHTESEPVPLSDQRKTTAKSQKKKTLGEC